MKEQGVPRCPVCGRRKKKRGRKAKAKTFTMDLGCGWLILAVLIVWAILQYVPPAAVQ